MSDETSAAIAGDLPFPREVREPFIVWMCEQVPPGTVIQTFQPGYVLYGRTVRPAMVIVAAKGGAAAAPGSTVDTQA